MADTRSTGSRRGARAGSPLEGPASDASEAVRQAAAVLEKELAAGVSGFRRLGAGVAKERRVDQEAFDEVLGRLRANASEFVGVAANRVGDLRSEDVQELANQFSTHAQDLLDTVISMVSIAPDMLNRVMAAGQGGGDRPSPRRASGSTKATKATKASASKSAAAKRPAKRAAKR